MTMSKRKTVNSPPLSATNYAAAAKPAYKPVFQTQYLGGLDPIYSADMSKHIGKMLNTNPWDVMSRNQRIVSVGGKPVEDYIVSHGGQSYARDSRHVAQGIGGASNEGITKRVQGRYDVASEEGLDQGGTGEVIASPHTMKDTSVNFATPVSDLYRSFFNRLATPAQYQQLTDELRNKIISTTNKRTGEVTVRKPYANIPNMDDPEIDKWFADVPEFRKAFVNSMQNTKKWSEMVGLNPQDVLAAFKDENLIGVPSQYMGHTLIEAVPGAPIQPSINATYSHDWLGGYRGSTVDTPVAIMLNKPFSVIAQSLRAEKPDAPREDIAKWAVGALGSRKHGVSEMISPEMLRRIEDYHLGLKQDKFPANDIGAALDYLDLPKFADGGMVDSVPEEAIKNTVRDPQAARLLDLDLAKYALMNQPQRMAGGGQVMSEAIGGQVQTPVQGEMGIKTFNDFRKDIGMIPQHMANGGPVHMNGGGRPPLRSLDEVPSDEYIKAELDRAKNAPTVRANSPEETANYARHVVERASRPLAMPNEEFNFGGRSMPGNSGIDINRDYSSFSVLEKPTYGSEVPGGVPSIDQQRYELTMKGQQEERNKQYRAQQGDALAGVDPTGTLAVADAARTLGLGTVALPVHAGRLGLHWLQHGNMKDAPTGHDYEELMSPRTAEGAELLEELGTIGSRLSGSEMGFGMNPSLFMNPPLTTAQMRAGLKLHGEKFAPKPNTKGISYVTEQQGPFYRVSPNGVGEGEASFRGIKETDGGVTGTDGSGTGLFRGKVPQRYSNETVEGLRADPNNFLARAANDYTQTVSGAPIDLAVPTSSSLAKQSAIGSAFNTGAEASPEYKSVIFDAYARAHPELLASIKAKNYDDLLEKAYRQVAKETDAQFKKLPLRMSYHKAGEGNYGNSKELLEDLYGNRHIYVYQGGDKHDFLHRVDPDTGLNENEKFRAVHDAFGHGLFGNQFGPKGEEKAWALHQQMYSPLAQFAMTAETRGQNSVVNYTPLNAELKKTLNEYDKMAALALRKNDQATYREILKEKKLAFEQFQFAPNKALLLPPEFNNPAYQGGMPDYMYSVIKPKEGTETPSVLTHFSNAKDLKETDPKRYGTGIRGAESARLKNTENAVNDRTHFYVGEPNTVRPESGLGPNRYRAESPMYDLAKDPMGFRTLSQEANRTPYTAQTNAGLYDPAQQMTDLERLVKEYGYKGFVNPKASVPSGVAFKPIQVERRAKGGAVNFAKSADEMRKELLRNKHG